MMDTNSELRANMLSMLPVDFGIHSVRLSENFRLGSSAEHTTLAL
jgi:hypothetical protein